MLGGDFNTVAKALVVLRYHRRAQAIENQRSFITAVSYVEVAASGVEIYHLTEEHLNAACDAIAKDYSDGGAYNLHKAVGEFAAHLDSNGLCRIPLNFKYAKMRRPDNAGGLEIQRLDDPAALETSSDKMAGVDVSKLLGALYQKVPRDHRYRLQTLILAILAAAGRRFAEVAALPLNCLSNEPTGAVSYTHLDVYKRQRVLYVDQSDPTLQQAIGVCGKRSLCHLDTPFSCYLFETFRPLRPATHQHVSD